MKIVIPSIVLVVFIFGACASNETKHYNLISKMFSLKYDKPREPDPEQLKIVRYILKNTYENNIHKMRGEKENEVYVHEDGSEAVFDKDGNIVTNSYNRGAYNYYSNQDEPIKKFIYDTAPWLYWGNTADDPTTFAERLYYYTLDLDLGIQSYIFDSPRETLEAVQFKGLHKVEKEVYYLFIKLLFNENYAITLNSENMEKLRDDGEYYYEYFYQIQEVLKVRNWTARDN